MFLPGALYLTTKIIKEFVIHLDVDLETLTWKIKKNVILWLYKKKGVSKVD